MAYKTSKRTAICLLFLLISITICRQAAGQTPVTDPPRPAPTPEDVVRISTNLVQVDVTVTDRDGRPVNDLKQNEIEIYENGQKQKVTGFNFVSNVKETVQPIKSTDKNAIPVPVP